MKIIYFAFLIFIFSVPEIFSQGGPPMITDDPYPVEKNHWEINLGFTGEILNSVQGYEAPLIDCNYGINNRMHLKFETPFVISHDNSAGNESGLGKSSIGVKWLIFDDKENKFGMGIFPAFDFNIINSSAERGLSEKGIQLFLPVSFMKTLGKTDLVLQVGKVISNTDNGGWRYGFLAGLPISNNLESAVELAGSMNTDLTDHQSFLNLGFRYIFSKTYTFLFSAGKEIISSSESSTIVYTGLKFFF